MAAIDFFYTWTGLFFIAFLLPSGNDLASFIDPADYFKSRNIPFNVEKLSELAVTPPTDGKSQLAQLLALRALAEDVAKVKKAKNFGILLKNIEEVAQGKKAQDLQGFAAEYARKTAVALGSKIEPPVRSPDGKFSEEVVKWFPKDSTLVFGIDFRSGKPSNKDILEGRKKLIKAVPAEMKEDIYKMAEEIGNVRLDHVSFSLVETPKNPADGKVFWRVSGKVDHKRLVSFLRKNLFATMQFKETKNFRGQPITQFWEPGQIAVVALVGESDILVAGPAAGPAERPDEKAGIKVLEEMLELQRGRLPSVLEGPLAASVKQVSPNAIGFLTGQIPEMFRHNLVNKPMAPFKTLPEKVLVEMSYVQQELKLQLRADMNSAEDAKAFVDSANNLVKLAIASLQNPPPMPPVPNPDKIHKVFTEILKNIKVEAKGQSVSAMMIAREELLNEFINFVAAAFSEMEGSGCGFTRF